MLNKLFITLFGQSAYNRYTAKPFHLWYPLLIMATGTATFMQDGWSVFGIFTFILGAGLGVVIVLAIEWDKVIEYWENINHHVELMNRVKDPDIWYALGYKKPPQSVRVIEDIDHGQGFIQTKIHDMSMSPTIMQAIANAVLSGNPFSENEIVNKRKIISAPKFRVLQKDMEQKQMLKPHNKKRRNQGFALTKKGLDIMYEYASESVKLEKQHYDEV
jgi:predicted transcriptional regulator